MKRRHWGQDLENSGWEQEYHWIAGNFFKWMGEFNPGNYIPRKIEDCPAFFEFAKKTSIRDKQQMHLCDNSDKLKHI